MTCCSRCVSLAEQERPVCHRKLLELMGMSMRSCPAVFTYEGPLSCFGTVLREPGTAAGPGWGGWGCGCCALSGRGCGASRRRPFGGLVSSGVELRFLRVPRRGRWRLLGGVEVCGGVAAAVAVGARLGRPGREFPARLALPAFAAFTGGSRFRPLVSRAVSVVGGCRRRSFSCPSCRRGFFLGCCLCSAGWRGRARLRPGAVVVRLWVRTTLRRA